MEATNNILKYALLIGVAVVGIALLAQITSTVATTLGSSDSITVGIGQEINFTVDEEPISLSYSPIVASTTVVGCPDKYLVEDTDYTMNNTGGEITFLNDSVTVVNGTYTSNHDVEVFYGTDDLVWAEVTTFVTFNCSDYAEVWDSGNYTLNETIARITVDSLGDMANNTAYCYNATGSAMYDGAECTIDYEFYADGVVGGIGADLANDGLDAIAEWGNWFGVIVVTGIAVVVIGLLAYIRPDD